ncbi:hypothetical protein BDV39DRAFT_177379 [Aspergillus sergii]|uniref:RING-type domain-containing protein n=1 Tax=Aspergillus sergii TaxID=1034303 RepID=A0A5N6WZA2_9EURO|nr:hypothetical protein BDV39DRAFT_177379 [Aspergillus sergii]
MTSMTPSNESRYKPPRIPLRVISTPSADAWKLQQYDELVSKAKRISQIDFRHIDFNPSDRPKPPPTAAPKTECVACFERLPSTYFPSESITKTCTHENETCKRCLRLYLTSQLDSISPEGTIACPVCGEGMSESDIQEWASQETFSRFLALKTQAEGGSTGGLQQEGLELSVGDYDTMSRRSSSTTTGKRPKLGRLWNRLVRKMSNGSEYEAWGISTNLDQGRKTPTKQ